MIDILIAAVKGALVTFGLLYAFSVVAQLYELLKGYVNYKKGQWRLNLIAREKTINDDRSALDRALGIKK